MPMEQAAVPRRHRSSAIVASGAECVAVRSVRFLGHVLGPFIARYTSYAHVIIRVLLPLTRAPIAARKSPAAAPYVCVGIRAPSREASRAAVHAPRRAPFRFPSLSRARLVVVAGPAAAYEICVATPSRRRSLQLYFNAWPLTNL